MFPVRETAKRATRRVPIPHDVARCDTIRIMFVDRVTIFVKGGDGGRGAVAFRREKYEPRGGPDGGDGGHGGHVIIRAVAGTDSLNNLMGRAHWRAQNGAPGGGANCTGRSAEDTTIIVPPGTVIFD